MPDERTAPNLWDSGDRQLMLHFAEIGKELTIFVFALSLVAPSEDRRGMDGDEHCGPGLAGEKFAALAADQDNSTEYRLRRRRPEANQDFRLNDFQFRFEPRLAGRDLADRWFLMQSALAALDPAEMLDRIGDINFLARNFCLGECTIEETTRRADEGMPLAVFPIAGLFAEENQARVRRPFAENCLSCFFVKVAAFTALRRSAEIFERMPLGQKVSGRIFGLPNHK